MLGVLLLQTAWAQGPSTYAEALADVQQGRFHEAIPILEKLLAVGPRDLKARNLLGIALMNAGRKEEANAQFQEALVIDQKFVPALKNLAVNEMELGQLVEARKHFERFLVFSPKDPVAHLYLGELEFGQKRYREAAAHYEQSGGMHLKDPQVLLHFAQSQVETRNFDAAARAIEQIPAGARSTIHFQAGVLLSRAEKYSQAAQQFQAAQSEAADPYLTGFNVVLTSLKAGEREAAIETGEALVAKGYRKAELYNLLAGAYNEAGQTQRAYDALRTATEIDPADENNYLDLVTIALDHNNLELGFEIAGIGLSHVPQSYRLRLQRGAVFAMTGRLSDAEGEFRAATRSAPDANIAYVALAMAQMQSGKVSDAVDGLRARRSQAPENFLINRYLGEALSREGVTPGTDTEKEAFEALQHAIRANPQSASAHVLLGKLFFARGDFDHAAQEFEEALKLQPADASPAYQLALVYRKRGNTAKADELFDLFSKAKKEDPNQTAARDLLKAIQQGSR